MGICSISVIKGLPDIMQLHIIVGEIKGVPVMSLINLDKIRQDVNIISVDVLIMIIPEHTL